MSSVRVSLSVNSAMSALASISVLSLRMIAVVARWNDERGRGMRPGRLLP